MTVTCHPEPIRRPRLWRQRGAWHECELAPCGDAGGLSWVYSHRMGRGALLDVSDCRVVRPAPFRLVIWEPLTTKAPGPHRASAHCCYSRTVIFYARTYQINRFKRWWRDRAGQWREGETGSFVEWDQIEFRFCWDEKVAFEGETFEIGGGTVMWLNAPGEQRRWWMRHGARRKRAEAA